jgi:NAD+ synthase
MYFDEVNKKYRGTRIPEIVQWIREYTAKSDIENLIIGISGGIDSSVTSTLCALTGRPTTVMMMPIVNSPPLAMKHAHWLHDHYDNVTSVVTDLTPVYDSFVQCTSEDDELALANARARIRMMRLYHEATTRKGIVVGTGNKVEDFGVGFFTKYGDGGVDISPIADCLKTEVWGMGKELSIIKEVIDAAPTDGLWADGRTDADQLGMDYEEIEEAMYIDKHPDGEGLVEVTDTMRLNVEKYRKLRAKSLHKMNPIPVCNATFKDDNIKLSAYSLHAHETPAYNDV